MKMKTVDERPDSEQLECELKRELDNRQNQAVLKKILYIVMIVGFTFALINEHKYANIQEVRQFGERVEMNAPIQGTAADIIKIAMVNIEKELEERKLKSKLILQVHDELVIEAPEDEIEISKELLVRNMQNVIKMKVPLKAEAGIGKTWYEAH